SLLPVWLDPLSELLLQHCLTSTPYGCTSLYGQPTHVCKKLKIPLDLSAFQFLSLFYSSKFGLYPCKRNLTANIEKASSHITKYISEFLWHALWARNWSFRDNYPKLSMKNVKGKRPTLSSNKVVTFATEEFQKVARSYLGEPTSGKLRPSRGWGYYLYPDCYSYDYNSNMEYYTGECPELEKLRNNELMWLWNESTALFPSIYLELVLQESQQAKLYVRHRIQEAIRVSKLSNKTYAVPVYAYIRPCFKDSDANYLSEYDLVNTIGEAAALGAAGVISWGDMNITNSEASCTAAKRHLEEVVNIYILNVTTATQLCSEVLCQAKGRCVRSIWDHGDYLHLSPYSYQIYMDNAGGALHEGQLSQQDIDWFEERFDCVCYMEEPCFAPLTLNKIYVFQRLFSTGPFLLFMLCAQMLFKTSWQMK
uniref:Hyaluronidase n=1 Tax=Pygocentrus nattereri TaxID=42514 RepID=A0A3B4CH73_PYGNA